LNHSKVFNCEKQRIPNFERLLESYEIYES